MVVEVARRPELDRAAAGGRRQGPKKVEAGRIRLQRPGARAGPGASVGIDVDERGGGGWQRARPGRGLPPLAIRPRRRRRSTGSGDTSPRRRRRRARPNRRPGPGCRRRSRHRDRRRDRQPQTAAPCAWRRPRPWPARPLAARTTSDRPGRTSRPPVDGPQRGARPPRRARAGPSAANAPGPPDGARPPATRPPSRTVPPRSSRLATPRRHRSSPASRGSSRGIVLGPLQSTRITGTATDLTRDSTPFEAKRERLAHASRARRLLSRTTADRSHAGSRSAGCRSRPASSSPHWRATPAWRSGWWFAVAAGSAWRPPTWSTPARSSRIGPGASS